MLCGVMVCEFFMKILQELDWILEYVWLLIFVSFGKFIDDD